MSKMLTPRQVGEQIDLHYKTVCDLISSGELRAFNVSGGTGTGKRYRIDQRDLDRWLESRQVTA